MDAITLLGFLCYDMVHDPHVDWLPMSESMLTARFLRNLLRMALVTITSTITIALYDSNEDDDVSSEGEPVEDSGR